jgi:hypothetical protein
MDAELFQPRMDPPPLAGSQASRDRRSYGGQAAKLMQKNPSDRAKGAVSRGWPVLCVFLLDRQNEAKGNPFSRQLVCIRG